MYAALVTSTVARGNVGRLDTAAALRHRGVLRVLTDFTGVKLPFDPRQVAYFGQPVAVVVGATLEAATHGASLVEVRYANQPQMTDIDAPQAVPQQGKSQHDYSRGNADESIRSAAVVTDLSYSIARNNHNPMELPATIASWDGDRLTVWDKVQGISSAQQAYAQANGVPAGPRPGDLTVRRRRFRQRGAYVAASTPRRVRRSADATSGQVGADPQADVQRDRLPAHQQAAHGHRCRPVRNHQRDDS